MSVEIASQNRSHKLSSARVGNVVVGPTVITLTVFHLPERMHFSLGCVCVYLFVCYETHLSHRLAARLNVWLANEMKPTRSAIS